MRTVPAGTYRAVRRGDYSILESYVGALRSAERFVYLENQFLWSPEVVSILAEKLENPPSDDFRVLVVLPARANDGADISRGQVAALIHAADETTRFLACTDLRAVSQPPRPRVHPREDRHRRRPLAHRRLGEPQRALALPRHGDERRHARSRSRAGDAAAPVVRAPRASPRGRGGRPDRAHRRALGAHRLGAARAPRGQPGSDASAREAAGCLASAAAPARPATEPASTTSDPAGPRGVARRSPPPAAPGRRGPGSGHRRRWRRSRTRPSRTRARR